MNIFASLAQTHRRVQTARQLRALPPHLLRDIGIEPGLIDETVSQMVAAQAAAEAPAATPKVAPEVVAFKPAVFSNGEWPYSRQRAA